MAARKAAQLVGAGVIAGFVIGGLLVGIVLPRGGASAGGAQGASPSAPGKAPVRADAAAALRGTTTLNGRLALEADPLATALAASSFPTQDVIAVLRRMSIDARAASAMVPSLGGWPDAATHEATLGTFYDQLTTQIGDALSLSVTNTAAYKAATTSILATLGRIIDLDAAARRLGDDAGINLPPVTIPATLH